MNREQAKQMSPIISAFAEGKEVQFRLIEYSTCWMDITLGFLSIDTNRFEYRIKPEKKNGWINIYKSGIIENYLGNRFYTSKEKADLGAEVHRVACIEISYEEGEGL